MTIHRKMDKNNNSETNRNIPSNLLSTEENEKIFSWLGRRCFTLSTAVVQVFLTDLPHHEMWQKKHCGVVCFVKDAVRKSYFIRVFDMDRAICVWEQELYHEFEYNSPRPFFHTFEADTCMAGLNFADNKEAQNFEAAVNRKLRARQMKRLEKKRNQQLSVANPPNVVAPASRTKVESMSSLTMDSSKKQVNDRTRRRGGKKLTKLDIGEPTNFEHVQHIGWDPVTGFDVENVGADMKTFFSMAGVSEKDLKDKETRNFIYDFIDKHGGVERAIQEINTAGEAVPPPLPTREVPLTPHPPRIAPSTRASAPPPPTALPVPLLQTNHSSPIPPPPPSRVPPPPRPPTSALKYPPPPNSPVPPIPPPPPPPTSVPPPPPPPPPLPTTDSLPPPPPPMPTSLNSVNGDSRSALMEQIRKGKTLQHVNAKGDSNSSTDTRGALLNQIRQGIELKPVAGEPKSLPTSAPMHGLAGALARALMERNRAIHETDDSDSDEDDDADDDEWED